MKLEPGMKLKRKNHNYATVTIVSVDDYSITIDDNGMIHYVLKDKVDDNFDMVNSIMEEQK